jgi:2-polyprenyl-3-methyl-5-hydroxy-6-metoxy-1,4-benzoquinol methylase
MDTLALPPMVADRTLRFLEMTNRRFGGTAVVLRHLDRYTAGWPAGRVLTVLDVGTGAADIPRALVAWATARRVSMQVTAIDMAPDIAEAARERVRGVRAIAIEQATLADVAASGRRFDYVTASLFLHHVPVGGLEHALLAIDRVAILGVIISDLVRSLAALAAVSVLSAVAGNTIVRHDAPLSVRRALTVSECAQLVAGLGLHYLQTRAEGPFRLSIAGEKGTRA